MDSSGVLLALEEQRKWRERRERILTRMQQLDRRRSYLQKELVRVRKKVSQFNAAVATSRNRPRTEHQASPPAVR